MLRAHEIRKLVKDMTYNQTGSNRHCPGGRGETSAQRSLHKSVNFYSDDVWHSVWKRIENANHNASPARSQGTMMQPPRDYAVALDTRPG
jgi:hypothetical protein